MTLYKNKYRIESARLLGWDYSSPGYYFITVCTHNRENLFGHIDNGTMCLNEYGTIVQNEWDKSFVIRQELLPDEFVVMPNHFHGIVRMVETRDKIGVNTAIVETSGRTSLRETKPQPTDRQPEEFPRIHPKSLSSFMAGFKSVVTKRINELRNTPGVPMLQYRFHDHIIRDANELFHIRQYIKDNPRNWESDKLNGSTGNRVNS